MTWLSLIANFREGGPHQRQFRRGRRMQAVHLKISRVHSNGAPRLSVCLFIDLFDRYYAVYMDTFFSPSNQSKVEIYITISPSPWLWYCPHQKSYSCTNCFQAWRCVWPQLNQRSRLDSSSCQLNSKFLSSLHDLLCIIKPLKRNMNCCSSLFAPTRN